MAKVGASLSGKSQSTVLLPLFLRAACSGGGSPLSAGSHKGVPVKLQSLESITVEESFEFVGTLEAKNRLIWRPETNGRVSEIFVTSASSLSFGTLIVQLLPEKGQAQVGGVNPSSLRATSNIATQMTQRESQCGSCFTRPLAEVGKRGGGKGQG